MLYTLYAMLAIFIGILASLFGLGGGFLIVPVLTISGIPIHHAIGTSSFIIVFSSLSAIVEYARQKKIDYSAGIMLAIPSIFGAYMGAYATTIFHSSELKIVFALALIMVAISMLRHDGMGKIKVKKWLIPIGGFFSGILAGFLGVGGGMINVPFLSYVGLSIHSAIATSSFSIFFSSFAASFKHYMLGNVEPLVVIIFTPGIIIGAQIGARIAKKIRAKNLKNTFAIFLIILAVLMILRG